MSAALFFQIYLLGFLINVVWEVCHSLLYTTCLNQNWRKNVPLLLRMAAKDAFFIVIFYLMTVIIFDNREILQNYTQLGLFIFLGLAFSFIDEKISLRRRRWEYAPSMPRVFGVGLTPLLEIAVTGVVTFGLVFLF